MFPSKNPKRNLPTASSFEIDCLGATAGPHTGRFAVANLPSSVKARLDKPTAAPINLGSTEAKR